MHISETQTDVIQKNNITQTEANEKFSVNLKKCFAAATKDIDGYKAFKYIKKICLWDEETTNTTMEAELYKKARRDVWLLIRKYIPDEVLVNIEIKDKENIFDELRKEKGANGKRERKS